MSQPSDQRDIQAQVRRILQEHRDGHFDQEKTAYLLERSISQQPQAVRHDIFETLWSALSTEPLSSPVQRGAFVPCVQAVVVRSIAEFGPTAELPERVFELLRRGDTPECTDFWARSICPSLTYFTFHNAARFPPETLDRAKKLCSAQLASDRSPAPIREALVFSVNSLADAIKSIEASRFAAQIESQNAHEEKKPMRLEHAGDSVVQEGARTKIFIGHGKAHLWKDLKDFIQDRLRLEPEEFNREPVAGLSTKERLESMLSNSTFAFLVMTAEDEGADGTKRARENVIHEAGLFQGRLGFERAIILIEDGCAEFSNIQGLAQIRFPKGDVAARFEEIRRVLERERIIGNAGDSLLPSDFHQGNIAPSFNMNSRLSGEGLVMLVAAVLQGGEIFLTSSDQIGEYIRIGPFPFPPDIDSLSCAPEAQERWLNGFHSLIEHHFVRRVAGNTHKITVSAYDLINELKDESKPLHDGRTEWGALTQSLGQLESAQTSSRNSPEPARNYEIIRLRTSELVELAGKCLKGKR